MRCYPRLYSSTIGKPTDGTPEKSRFFSLTFLGDIVYPDRDGVLEHDPVDRLLAAARGQGAVVVEILVHQDGQEVHHVHV